MTKAILFDVDGVLIDSLHANWQYFADLMEYAGYKPPTLEEYKTIFHLSAKDVIKTLAKTASEKELTRIFQVIGADKIRYADELVIQTDDAADVFAKLSQKYTLGIVSSRVRAGVHELPQVSGLLKYTKTAVTYEDTEKHKPDPEPLFLAAKQLKIDSSEAVYIGDAKTDLQAARAAGMKFIACPAPIQGEQADAVVTSLSELLTVIPAQFP